jgi:hypothetical protein
MAEHPQPEAVDRALVQADQLAEGGTVAGESTGQKGIIPVGLGFAHRLKSHDVEGLGACVHDILVLALI